MMESTAIENCTLKVEGMTCSSCVQVCHLILFIVSLYADFLTLQSIESYIGKLQGVESIQVALLSEKATINYIKDYWDPEKLANVSCNTYLQTI